MLLFHDNLLEPHWKRRNQQQDAKNQQHKVHCEWDPGGICSHGIHGKYLIDLWGPVPSYMRNPPNMEHQNTWKHVHPIIGELQDYLYFRGLGDHNQ